MIADIISRYKPKYVRALVYMLQASEYYVSDYLGWYHRAGDFNDIEKRKNLVMTAKARILFSTAWIFLILLYLAGILILVKSVSYWGYLSGFILIILTPYILAYLMLIPLAFIKLAQIPFEFVVRRKIKENLRKTKALKIAIAGSYGKTSMREILRTVLSERKKVASPPQSYNTLFGIEKFVKTLKGDEEVLIFELGEYYPGDVMKLCRMILPDVGIITGVNEAHIERFKNIKNTTKTIFELADFLGNKPLYVNAENHIAKKYASHKSILYSRNGVGTWGIKSAFSDLDGTRFVLYNTHEEIDAESKLLGLHQIGPLVVAADIVSKMGFSGKQIRDGISKTKPFEHRLESKIDASGVIILDDSYNGNPDGVKAIIDFLSGIKNHKRIYVTPGLVEMGEFASYIHKKIGFELAKAGIEEVVLVKNSVTPFIEEGLKTANYSGKIIWFDDALSAYKSLPQMTVKGDLVVLQNDWPDQYA